MKSHEIVKKKLMKVFKISLFPSTFKFLITDEKLRLFFIVTSVVVIIATGTMLVGACF